MSCKCYMMFTQGDIGLQQHFAAAPVYGAWSFCFIAPRSARRLELAVLRGAVRNAAVGTHCLIADRTSAADQGAILGVASLSLHRGCAG
mmetsp:Transcript_5429/g.11931  ORF Transcript_5429/g.11931 Transcript_5429/m.11931 type:complete len:89 (-) Transcript_5429:172-438(-)